MATDADRAQDLELAEYERNQAKAIMDPPAAPSKTACVDCGDEIPQARRLASLGCTRCVDCQTEMERYGKC